MNRKQQADERIRNHIRAHLRRTGLTQHELSFQMGRGKSFINDLLKQTEFGISARRVKFLEQFFNADFSDAYQSPHSHQSWLETVRKLRDKPPVYARAW